MLLTRYRATPCNSTCIIAHQGLGPYLRPHQSTQNTDQTQNLINRAVIKYQHRHTLPNQVCCNVGLEIGKPKHQVRLQRHNPFNLGADECRHFGFFTPCTRRTNGKTRDTDYSVFLSQEIEYFSRLLGQTHDALWQASTQEYSLNGTRRNARIAQSSALLCGPSSSLHYSLPGRPTIPHRLH